MPTNKVRSPALSVKLLKNIGRSSLNAGQVNAIPVSTRFQSQNSEIDLTRFLGERGTVFINKSVREPSGSFRIDLTDDVVGDSDSLYGLLEPMDVIEIRMAAEPHIYGATSLPIMMRGFISDVSRYESMGADGRPQRRVTISGQDYGKIWQIYQIFFLPWAPSGQADLLTNFTIFQRFGLSFRTMYAEDFVSQVVTRILNPFIAKIKKKSNSGRGNSTIVDLIPDMQVRDGVVSPFGIGDWQGGTVYQLLASQCDLGEWNELFIDDQEDGPHVVFRPNPFKALDKKTFLQPMPKPPAQVSITRNDVISIEAHRSDNNVANYFWVDSPRYNMNYDMVGKSLASIGPASEFFVTNYGNVDPDLYGKKKMEAQTNQGGRDEIDSGNGTNDKTHAVGQGYALAWVKKRRLSLISQNRDNVILENGTMQLKGNEKIRAGTYLSLKHGSMISEYYVVSARHSFSPFGSYITSVVYERGTGFIDRAQQGGGNSSPYWSEVADGAPK